MVRSGENAASGTGIQDGQDLGLRFVLFDGEGVILVLENSSVRKFAVDVVLKLYLMNTSIAQTLVDHDEQVISLKLDNPDSIFPPIPHRVIRFIFDIRLHNLPPRDGSFLCGEVRMSILTGS
jgi:hypothetical protein